MTFVAEKHSKNASLDIYDHHCYLVHSLRVHADPPEQHRSQLLENLQKSSTQHIVWLQRPLDPSRTWRRTSTYRPFSHTELFHTSTPSTMSFASNSIADICSWTRTTDKHNIDRFCQLSAEQVTRRICRYGGVPTTQILGTHGCREHLCELLCAQLKLQTCSGAQEHRIRQQQMYSAIWTFLFPEHGQRPRGDRLLWQMQFCISVSITVATFAETQMPQTSNAKPPRGHAEGHLRPRSATSSRTEPAPEQL